MAWSFGDGFDLYTANTDVANGYWDSGGTSGQWTWVAGRFSGSQALQSSAASVIYMVKSSGQNDAVHHIAVAFKQTAATIANLGLAFNLVDGSTTQCSIVFRGDGDIRLTSGGATGTTLATYTGGALPLNTWIQFEFEVVINSATGSFKVRKNGNTTEDFTATSLNTRVSANNYANKLQIGFSTGPVNNQLFDDFFWKSDATSVAWLGDIRCFTRMPASDAAVTFARTPTTNTQTPVTASTTAAITLGVGRYTAFTAAYDGTIGAATVSLGTGYTGNLKASIFADASAVPTTVLGSATTVVNPGAGSNALTFGSPVTVVKGTQYWIGFDSDTSSGTWSVASGTTGKSSTTAYASFPAASPSTANAAAIVCSLTIATTANYTVVNEAQQDALTSYVYDSTPGDADFYGISSIASTPATVIATTVRAYALKSDAGTRTAAVQIKSGGTTVASPTLTLTTSGWQWAWRTDTTDPATGAAWTPAAVNTVQIGPLIVA